MEGLSVFCISSAIVLIPVALLCRKKLPKSDTASQSNQSSSPMTSVGSPQNTYFDQRGSATSYNSPNRGSQYSQVHNRGRR